ncbi:MAG: ribosome maturation factor RimM [Clostridia bacterium]|nr:ribosome maturation factor RimM [Clostridia bacterium]
MTKERIVVGRIAAPHGIRGELKVIPLTDFPQRFRPGTRLFIQQGEKTIPTKVTRARHTGSHIILKLAEINDANQAEAVQGAVLQVEPWEVEPLPEGHYYHFQLIGSQVFTVAKDYLGNLTDILTTGANDVYVVRNEDGREILIPALKSVVRRVDLAKKELYVELPPGLLD